MNPVETVSPFSEIVQEIKEVGVRIGAARTGDREIRKMEARLTLLETENLLLNGFKSAFLQEKSKEKLVRETIETFASLRDKFGLDERRPAP